MKVRFVRWFIYSRIWLILTNLFMRLSELRVYAEVQVTRNECHTKKRLDGDCEMTAT